MKLLLAAIGALIAALSIALLGVAAFAPPDDVVFRPSKSERHFEVHRTESGEPAYSLNFVEFDDEGAYADGPGQKEAAVAALRGHIASEVDREVNGTIVLVYVHGLNHNAHTLDDNVGCFAELLDATATMQRPRRVGVAGVYIGWPGRAYDSDALNSVVAYYGREAAADRIAERGDLLDLFTAISRARHQSKSRHTRLVIIGHSLGGRAAYLALRPIMQRNLDEALQGRMGERSVIPIADVTVFANPAFSADEHRTMHRLMSASATGPTVAPSFILMTSTGDEVLKRAFQISQKFSSFFRGDYLLDDAARWEAAGHHTPYLTHDLRIEDGRFDLPTADDDRRCPRFVASELEIVRGMARASSIEELYRISGVVHRDDAGNGKYRTTLRRIRGRSSGDAMVLRVDDQIVPSHNDIFTTPMVDFVARILNCSYGDAKCAEQLDRLEEIGLDGTVYR